MRLKLTLNRGGHGADILVTVDGTATVGDLALALLRRDPVRQGAAPPTEEVTLRRESSGQAPILLPDDVQVTDSGLRSGDIVSVARADHRHETGQGNEVAVLRVLSGPDAGLTVPLRAGTSHIGRSSACEVRLSDPTVSSRHARLIVADVVDLVDANSSNGIHVADVQVPRIVMRPQTRAFLGDTEVAVIRTQEASASTAPTVMFNRSPFVLDRYEGEARELPEVPQRRRPNRLPLVAMLTPALLGLALYAVTRAPATLIFVAASPMMLLGGYVDSRLEAKRERRLAEQEYADACQALRSLIDQGLVEETASRRAEHPDLPDLVRAAADRSAALWRRRRTDPDVMTARIGTGSLPARSTLTLPRKSPESPLHLAMAQKLVRAQSSVTDVPVTLSLRTSRSVGFAGAATARDIARSFVADLVISHSPADVVVAAVTSTVSVDGWRWLRWLPHTSSPHSPLAGEHLACDPGRVGAVVGEVESLITERLAARQRDAVDWPRVVLIVEDDAPVDRSRLVAVAESGADAGVHVVWCARDVDRLPAACRAFVDADGSRPALVADADTGTTSPVPVTGRLDAVGAEYLGRDLSPVVDAGARVPDDSDLPRSVGWLTLAGTELGEAPDRVLEGWAQNESIIDRSGHRSSRRTRDRGLRALVGMAAGEPLHLDLRVQGPHALVGGTTGSGKSEFLQAWVLGMASAYSPDRLTFLFVDYKGGTAFADCERLPHSVGMVTDLGAHLVRRALQSLGAELRWREHLFNEHAVKSLIEFEHSEAAHLAPPSLVILIDEFAALVNEVPEFVDGLVDIAQRGRSLGVHLVMATQRPAGVIKENLRANTNLRVALRVADADDSMGVLGVPDAAHFDPATPGRAAVSVGAGRVTRFQSGYAGGHTSDAPPPPRIDVVSFAFGVAQAWVDPEPPRIERPAGPADIARVVSVIEAAAARVAIRAPRRPWLDELPRAVDMLRGLGTDSAEGPMRLASLSDDRLILGIADDPERQQQPAASFSPDEDGGMVVIGAGGSGKSCALRTVAIAAGLTPEGGPCHVYALDFGSAGLSMLEPLPHVAAVVSGDDKERVARVVSRLVALVEERAGRYAAANAATIGAYRHLAGRPDEARVLIVLDGLAAFRERYEHTVTDHTWRDFSTIAIDGRAVGVHVVASAVPGSVPPSLSSALQRRVVLRLGGEGDYGLLGLPSDVLSVASPPGRGLLDGLEFQVAVPGGSPDVARQAGIIAGLAEWIAAQDRPRPEPVGRLRDDYELTSLPRAATGVTIGVDDQTLGPIGIAPRGTFLVCGPAGTGRADILETLTLAVAHSNPAGRLCYVGPRGSQLARLDVWSAHAADETAVAELCATILDKPEMVALLLLENLLEWANTPVAEELIKAIKACSPSGLVVSDGDTGALGTNWPALLPALKAQSRGFALQPDAADGESVFKTSFGRVTRSEFPSGRGLLVQNGLVRRIQMAHPS